MFPGHVLHIQKCDCDLSRCNMPQVLPETMIWLWVVKFRAKLLHKILKSDEPRLMSRIWLHMAEHTHEQTLDRTLCTKAR